LLVKKPFEQLSSSDWQRSFNVNFFGPVELTQLCLPLLKNSEQGHILNITSMGGFQGSSKFPGLSAYSASKAALGNLTECLAEELKEENVAVNALALGAVQTEMLAEAFPGFEPPMHSEQMARFIADFAVNGRQFFNGKVLPVSTSTP
jgi:3-oxoacyl-[acyl-carrier protein] reductase